MAKNNKKVIMDVDFSNVIIRDIEEKVAFANLYGEISLEKNFEINPTCKNCHDDKNYPEYKPGKFIENK